jgi:hypothetical protein
MQAAVDAAHAAAASPLTSPPGCGGQAEKFMHVAAVFAAFFEPF